MDWKWRNFSMKITKMTPWENKKVYFSPNIHYYMAWKDLYGTIKFALMNIKCISHNPATNFESCGLKMTKFQQENHQNDPLRKQKCLFFFQYPILYGLKWLVWSYKFVLMNIKCISYNSGTNFEFYGLKMAKFKHENHQNDDPWENKKVYFSPNNHYCMAWKDLYGPISLFWWI